MLETTVTGTRKNYFVVWICHEMIADEIYLDNEILYSIKKVQKIL